MQRVELIERLAEKMYNSEHSPYVHPYKDASEIQKDSYRKLATIAIDSLVVDAGRTETIIYDNFTFETNEYGDREVNSKALASAIANDGEVWKVKE